jgi:hypothetical protein
LYTLLPGAGSYSIVAEGPERGFLGPTRNNNTFDVSSNGSFVEVAYFIKIPPTPPPTATSTRAFTVAPLRIWSRRRYLRMSFGFVFVSIRG